jgi:phage-related protein
VVWTIVYYSDAQDREPVKEFARGLAPPQRKRVYWTIDLLREFGTSLPMPHARHLEDGLWELRTQSGRSIFRIIYFNWTEQRFVLLTAFQKKTDATPSGELEWAKRRREDWLQRKEGKP